MADAVVLLPRLEPADVQRILDALDPVAGPATPSTGMVELPDAATFGPVGGRRVSVEELSDLRRAIFEVAQTVGFPDVDTTEARGRFDAACAPVLATSPLFASGEALRDDTWAFVASSLAAPVTFWRYGGSPDRWYGGVRNTFQRLWLRARALDRGAGARDRWGLVTALTEDAFVAIVERPALAGQQPLATAIGEGWVRAAGVYGRNRMQSIMRDAVITLRLRNEITALRQLPPSELDGVVDDAFRRAGEALGDGAAATAAAPVGSSVAQASEGTGDGWLRKAFSIGRNRRR